LKFQELIPNAASSSADLGGSSKYSNENFEGRHRERSSSGSVIARGVMPSRGPRTAHLQGCWRNGHQR